MPLTKDIELKTIEKKEYDLIPADIYQVQLMDITDQEVETYDSRMGKTDETEHEVVLSFTFGILKEGELRGRFIWANFIPTMFHIGRNGKNKLYKICEALQGEELNESEVAEFESGGGFNEFLGSLVGKQCRVLIEHKKSKSGDKTFANPVNFLTIEEEMEGLPAEGEAENILEEAGF